MMRRPPIRRCRAPDASSPPGQAVSGGQGLGREPRTALAPGPQTPIGRCHPRQCLLHCPGAKRSGAAAPWPPERSSGVAPEGWPPAHAGPDPLVHILSRYWRACHRNYPSNNLSTANPLAKIGLCRFLFRCYSDPKCHSCRSAAPHNEYAFAFHFLLQCNASYVAVQADQT